MPDRLKLKYSESTTPSPVDSETNGDIEKSLLDGEVA